MRCTECFTIGRSAAVPATLRRHSWSGLKLRGVAALKWGLGVRCYNAGVAGGMRFVRTKTEAMGELALTAKRVWRC